MITLTEYIVGIFSDLLPGVFTLGDITLASVGKNTYYTTFIVNLVKLLVVFIFFAYIAIIYLYYGMKTRIASVKFEFILASIILALMIVVVVMSWYNYKHKVYIKNTPEEQVIRTV